MPIVVFETQVNVVLGTVYLTPYTVALLNTSLSSEAGYMYWEKFKYCLLFTLKANCVVVNWE